MIYGARREPGKKIIRSELQSSYLLFVSVLLFSILSGRLQNKTANWVSGIAVFFRCGIYTALI
jgi:hypothetical protein